MELNMVCRNCSKAITERAKLKLCRQCNGQLQMNKIVKMSLAPWNKGKQTIPADLSGQKFNRLTVVRFSHFVKEKDRNRRYWLCKCDCGKETPVREDGLGQYKSCGCYNIEQSHLRKSNLRHGLSDSRLFRIYSKLRSRCNNSKDQNYKNYGGRGIKCLWTSFEHFVKDMKEGHDEHLKLYGEKNTTIERIDVNGNYCKENCRWATKKEQANNQRRNRLLYFNGQVLNMKQWAERLNLPYYLIQNRIDKYNWSIEKALTTPKMVNF